MVNISSSTARSNRRKSRCGVVKILNTIIGLTLVFTTCSYMYMIQNIHDPESLLESDVKDQLLLPYPAISSPTTIGYAVSLTACGDEHLGDGAAVLKHSIHLNSVQNHRKSKYNYRMIAIVHPNAVSCSGILEQLGYDILIRDTPVEVEEIQGEFLRSKVKDNGCCGETEFIKLWAYTLTKYPVVVHLDLDTVVLQPMDELFDVMIDGYDEKKLENKRMIFNNAERDELNTVSSDSRVDAFFTRDYNMARPTKKHVGVQGGFLVLRPNVRVRGPSHAKLHPPVSVWQHA